MEEEKIAFRRGDNFLGQCIKAKKIIQYYTITILKVHVKHNGENYIVAWQEGWVSTRKWDHRVTWAQKLGRFYSNTVLLVTGSPARHKI